jgi:integrase
LDTTTETRTVAGDTILEYIKALTRKQKKPRTIKLRVYYLEKLKQNGADLSNPISVETVLAKMELTTAQKYNAIVAYKSYCKVFKIQWDDPPKIDYQPKKPFIPTKDELETLIHAAGRRTATLLQVAYTTGARVGEICQIRYADVNVEALTIDINHPEKGSKPRTIPVPEKTIAMINNLPRKYGEYVFNPNPATMRSNLVYLRKKLASTYGNDRFKRIHMHTFRHFFARKKLRESMGNKTYVQYLLGHKSILSTERYTELEEYRVDEKYQSAVAMTLKDAQRLIEDGYTYVCDFKGHPLFRKVV